MHKGINSTLDEGQTPVVIGGCFDSSVQPLPFDTTQITSAANYSNPQSGDPCHPLAAGAHAPAIAYGFYSNEGSHGMGDNREVSPSLRIDGNGAPPPAVAIPEVSGTLGGGSGQRGWSNDLDRSGAFVPQGAVVRRLTATECEALQGFPRNWTSEGIDKSGKRIAMADSSRYRQLGNAVTVNVAEWIARRVISCADAPSC